LKGHIEATASRLVLREAERNLRRKGLPKNLKAFHQFLNLITLDRRHVMAKTMSRNSSNTTPA
jgi:hypothetical protein